MTNITPGDRVRWFIGDWGTAWHETRWAMDGKLGCLARWGAVIRQIDERHFVPGAACGSRRALSLIRADHDVETERIIDVCIEGAVALVRTAAPHPHYANRTTHYAYRLQRFGETWRIVQLDTEPDPQTASQIAARSGVAE